jgi:gem associated protein 6
MGHDAHAVYKASHHLVGKAVIVRLRNFSFMRGALFSIDPENGNVILFALPDNEQHDGIRTNAIMAHAVTSVESDDEGTDIQALRAFLGEDMRGKHESVPLATSHTTPEELQTFLHQVFTKYVL